MKETEVLEHVARRLDNLNYIFFIDSGYPESVVTGLSQDLENCRVNRTITIGRRIPDIIGFTSQREIFAVEVKGESAIRKGIGQAAHYRQGVHISYLAASDSALSEFRETALSCGLGIFSAKTDGDVSENAPVTNIGATDIDRTRRALAVKTSRLQSDQNSFPPTSRPEKSLLPVITIATEPATNSKLDDVEERRVLSEEQCENTILESSKTFNQPKPAISLALTLQFIRKSHSGPGGVQLELTDVGRSAYLMLAGLVESRKQADLYEFISSINRKKYLYRDVPELAATLRDRYLALPDIRLLVYVLASHKGSDAELTQILAEIALASPDAFLNLFCGRGKDNEFRELIENAQPDPDDISFRNQIIELTSPNALYNFVYQIRAIGILTKGTQAVHQRDHNDIEVGDFHWNWDPKLIGELGAESF